MPLEKFSSYLKLTSNIKALSNSMVPEQFEPTELNELLLVKYNGLWHRAAVLKLENYPAELKVALIDLMIDISVSGRDIHKIPAAFTKEAFTQLCYVDGVTDKNIDAFKALLECGPKVATSVAINSDDDFRVLKFDHEFD
jgi:hypothetical protein